MKTGDILINTIISILVAAIATFIYDIFRTNLWIIVIISFFIMSIFWLSSFINEVHKSSKLNLMKINKNKEQINLIRKDLNISERLSKLEEWRINISKMSKKGEVTVPDIIRIVGAILVLLVLLSVLGVFG